MTERLAVAACLAVLKRGSLHRKGYSWRTNLGKGWRGQARTFSHHTVARVLALGLARRTGDMVEALAAPANDNGP